MLEVIDCFMEEDSPGAVMMRAMPKSACDKTLQAPVVTCVMKEAKVHPAMLAKVMSKLGHLGQLCNKMAVRLEKSNDCVNYCLFNRMSCMGSPKR